MSSTRTGTTIGEGHQSRCLLFRCIDKSEFRNRTRCGCLIDREIRGTGTESQDGEKRNSYILNTSHVAKKALNKKSPYYEMTKTLRDKMQESLRQGMHPEIVAEIITKAALSSKPHRKHTAGDATEILLYQKRKRTDKQFEQFVKDIFFK